MFPLESSYHITPGHEYVHIAEIQGKDIKNNHMIMIEVLKGEMNKSLSEMQNIQTKNPNEK